MIRTEFFDPDRLSHSFFRMTEVGYNRNRELQIHNRKREEIIQSMKTAYSGFGILKINTIFDTAA